MPLHIFEDLLQFIAKLSLWGLADNIIVVGGLIALVTILARIAGV